MVVCNKAFLWLESKYHILVKVVDYKYTGFNHFYECLYLIG